MFFLDSFTLFPASLLAYVNYTRSSVKHKGQKIGLWPLHAVRKALSGKWGCFLTCISDSPYVSSRVPDPGVRDQNSNVFPYDNKKILTISFLFFACQVSLTQGPLLALLHKG